MSNVSVAWGKNVEQNKLHRSSKAYWNTKKYYICTSSSVPLHKVNVSTQVSVRRQWKSNSSSMYVRNACCIDDIRLVQSTLNSLELIWPDSSGFGQDLFITKFSYANPLQVWIFAIPDQDIIFWCTLSVKSTLLWEKNVRRFHCTLKKFCLENTYVGT